MAPINNPMVLSRTPSLTKKSFPKQHTGYEQWKNHKFNKNSPAKYNYYHGYVKFFQKDVMIVIDVVVGVNLKEQQKISP